MVVNNRVQKKSFVYKPRSAESAQKRVQGDNLFDKYFKEGIQVLTLKEGKHKLRILPPTWDNAEHYGFDIYVNYNVGPDKQSYLSLAKMKREKDPLAEERTRAQHDGREEDAKALSPNKHVLVWAVDRKAENEGPKLWKMPGSIDKEIISRSFDDESGAVINVDDPYDGYDITFTKEGAGLKTRYTRVEIARSSSPLSSNDATVNEWLEYVQENPIPSLLRYYSYDHIKAAFSGTTDLVQNEVASNASYATSEDDEDSFDDSNLVGKETVDIEDEVSALDEELPFEPDPPKTDAKAIGSRLKLRRRE